MSALEKLLIRGIRSFDDKQASVIEFYSPVTVIVGHNGSGKTTIIECLKYATTGDQPPNTKGGAFIHDPKIANEKEVKAQVKLRFRGANAMQMLAVRNLSVTVKKTGLTMKTLESLLAKYPYKQGDKRGVLSTKCAELDGEIPNLLGVSKAVLENVIFCHQEDSYWPLAEASVLKKKFDDIFEATKYTKALDAIKNLRKERTADMKAEKERLSHLQLEKSRAEKLKARILELTQSISKMEADEEELAAEVQRVDQENILYVATATQFNQTYTIVEGLEARIEETKKDITEQERTTQELDDTEEELEAKIQNHNKHKSTLEREGLRLKAALNEEKARLEEERENLNKTTRLLGQLQAEAKAHEQKVHDREDLIRSLAGKHSIKGYDHTPLEEDRVADFESKLREIHQRMTSQYEKLVDAGNAKTSSLSNNLLDLTSQQTQHKIERDNARQNITKIQSKISADESKVDGSSMVHTELKYSEGELHSTRSRLEAAKEAYLVANHDAAIKAKSVEREKLEAEKNATNARMRSLTLQADTRARLAIKKGEVSKKKGEINLILETNNQRLQELAGTEAQASTMEQDVERATAEKEKLAGQLEKNAADANANLVQIENAISSLTEELKKKKGEIKALITEIAPVLQPDNHEPVETVAAAISLAQSDADRFKDDMSALSTSRGFFETYLKQGLKGGKVCKMCDHKMSDKEWTEFEKKESFGMAKRLEKSSEDALGELRNDIRWCEDHVRSLQALLPKEAARDRLKSQDIPALEKQLADNESKLDAASKRAESANEELKAVKTQLRELRILQSYASTVNRTQKEVEKLHKEIKELELSLASSGSTETTDDIQVQLDAVDAKLKTLDRERSNIEASRDHELSMQRTMQNELHALEMKHQELEMKAKERDRLQQTIADLKGEVSSCLNRVKELDNLMQRMEEPLARLNYEIEEHKRKHEVELRAVGKTVSELHHSRDTLEQHNEAIEGYVKTRRARELKKCEDRVADIEKAIVELNDAVRLRSDELAAVTKQEHEGGATYARYTDNLRLRRLRSKLVQLQTELAGYDMEEAARAKRNFDKTYPKMQRRLEELKDRRARLGGELSTQKSHLENMEGDLASDFHDINKRYKDQLVQVKISDMANSDLEKYAKALDSAIMKYHSLKMEEVNETMRHLWNKTYQGTDIDGIKIRSDNGGATTTRRTYNYRVVMTKDQVEMDMRGRCSAGQKMLASIIIRLALSDSFGQNCGILALDEPTNALDAENIDALADSLVDIIRERRTMSNFQLIVITHDEKFLQRLGQADVMEYYWRVMRDRSQKSVIERHRFGVDAS